MATIQHPETFLSLLTCPDNAPLTMQKNGNVICADGTHQYQIEDNILKMVKFDELNAETKRELKGNSYDLTDTQIAAAVADEQSYIWRSYYGQHRAYSIKLLANFIDKTNYKEIFFLGSGTGRDVLFLSKFLSFQTVYCSDLSFSALKFAPYQLADHDLDLGLFTSNLDEPVIKKTNIPIAIVNALHHTEDLHAALERFLQKGYPDLFIVEPTGNWMIRLLAKFNLARREEYSGLQPDRLYLPQLKKMAAQHGYTCTIRTVWQFPDDYYHKLMPRSARFQAQFLRLLRSLSRVTNLFQFGNSSVVHLTKQR